MPLIPRPGRILRVDPVFDFSDDNNEHLVCCADHDRGLCGEYLPDDTCPWSAIGTAINCAACIEADENDQCPWGWDCDEMRTVRWSSPDQQMPERDQGDSGMS